MFQMNEKELKKQVREYLDPDFVIREEVDGVHIVTGEKLRIDFLIYPKEHLIERGFEKFWIGVEVKSPNVKEKRKNGTRLAWQAITYQQSIFKENITTAFVLTYPFIVEFFQELSVRSEQTGNYYNFREGKCIAEVLQHANIGHLAFGKNGFWSIMFASGQYYFCSTKGKGVVKNLGTKLRIGSTKRNLTTQ